DEGRHHCRRHVIEGTYQPWCQAHAVMDQEKHRPEEKSGDCHAGYGQPHLRVRHASVLPKASSARLPAAMPASVPTMRPELNGSPWAATATVPAVAAAAHDARLRSEVTSMTMKMSGMTKSRCHSAGRATPIVAPTTPAPVQATQQRMVSSRKYAPGLFRRGSVRKRLTARPNTWSV